MKKLFLLAAAVVLFAAPAMAATLVAGGGIRNSKHNLGSTGGGSFTTNLTSQICVFCHTPHNSDGAATRPLWTRSTTAVTAVYTSPTLSNIPSASLATVAPLCLSCHDGSTGLGTGVNGGTSTSAALETWTNAINGVANLGGGNLANDHPVGMTYDTSRDTGTGTTTSYASGLRAIDGTPGPKANWFRANNVMDCSSCHELHNSLPYDKFLRVTRDSSSLCLTCHVK